MSFHEFQGQKWGNYRKILQAVFVLAVFGFLGRMVWENWNQVKEASFPFRFFPLILSTLIFAFSYFIQIWAWYLVTLKSGIAISLKETIGSWFYSQLGKYLPGKVWLLLGRVYFYEAKGKSRRAITVALYFETATMIIASGLVFFFSLPFLKEIKPFYHSIFWFPLFLASSFFFLHPKVLQNVLNIVLRLLKREPVIISVSYSDVLWILGVCVLSWLVGGVGFYLFVDSVFPVSSEYSLFLTGALAMSSTLGLLALFAPSGLGVREGVLVSLLSLIMPSAVAVILSVLTRLWMTLIEIGLIGVVYLIDQLKKRE